MDGRITYALSQYNNYRHCIRWRFFFFLISAEAGGYNSVFSIVFQYVKSIILFRRRHSTLVRVVISFPTRFKQFPNRNAFSCTTDFHYYKSNSYNFSSFIAIFIRDFRVCSYGVIVKFTFLAVGVVIILRLRNITSDAKTYRVRHGCTYSRLNSPGRAIVYKRFFQRRKWWIFVYIDYSYLINFIGFCSVLLRVYKKHIFNSLAASGPKLEIFIYITCSNRILFHR